MTLFQMSAKNPQDGKFLQKVFAQNRFDKDISLSLCSLFFFYFWHRLHCEHLTSFTDSLGAFRYYGLLRIWGCTMRQCQSWLKIEKSLVYQSFSWFDCNNILYERCLSQAAYTMQQVTKIKIISMMIYCTVSYSDIDDTSRVRWYLKNHINPITFSGFTAYIFWQCQHYFFLFLICFFG